MDKTNEDENNVNKSSGNDYISLINKAKDPFKKEIFKIPTREEKLIYIRHQIQKYSIMKEDNRLSSLMSIFVSFIIIISFIVLFARTSSTLFFKSLMFSILVMAGFTWIALFINMKKNNRNYSIIIFALEELNNKVLGSIEVENNAAVKLDKELKNITDAIDETRRQVKEGYAIVEQKLRENFTE